MGKQSPFKPAYDDYAQQYFARKNWNSWVVNMPRQYCDVLGISGLDIALVEVKSPSEITVGRNCEDELPPGSKSRKEIWTIIDKLDSFLWKRNKTLLKLYAISIGCQLLQYVYEYPARQNVYQKSAPDSYPLPPIDSCAMKPYFVVPVEAKEIALIALDVLINNNVIKPSPPVDSDCKIFVAQINFYCMADAEITKP